MIACGSQVIARRPRSYEREDTVFEPLHYLASLEQKTGALDQAAPLAGEMDPVSVRIADQLEVKDDEGVCRNTSGVESVRSS